MCGNLSHSPFYHESFFYFVYNDALKSWTSIDSLQPLQCKKSLDCEPRVIVIKIRWRVLHFGQSATSCFSSEYLISMIYLMKNDI